jgi:hypothetical protein
MDLERIAAVELPVDEAVIEAELNDYVQGAPLAGRIEPWKITNVGQADWVMRKLADVTAYRQELDDQVSLWQAARDRVKRAGEWFEARLREWAIAQRTKERKTFPLAHGTVGTRESKARITVFDEQLAIEWARKACPGAIKKSESFLISQVTEAKAASIEEFVVAWRVTDKATGEQTEHAPGSVVEVDDLRASGHVVEMITELRVVDAEGKLVPGLGVREAEVTATVTPLGL